MLLGAWGLFLFVYDQKIGDSPKIYVFLLIYYFERQTCGDNHCACVIDRVAVCRHITCSYSGQVSTHVTGQNINDHWLTTDHVMLISSGVPSSFAEWVGHRMTFLCGIHVINQTLIGRFVTSPFVEMICCFLAARCKSHFWGIANLHSAYFEVQFVSIKQFVLINKELSWTLLHIWHRMCRQLCGIRLLARTIIQSNVFT